MPAPMFYSFPQHEIDAGGRNRKEKQTYEGKEQFVLKTMPKEVDRVYINFE